MLPDTIAHYEIIRQIAAGGMATVYEARDPTKNGRLVAIKVIATGLAQHSVYIMRFQREMELVAALEAPSIVPVYDYGEDRGRLYIVMRYMPDGSLQEELATGPLSPQRVHALLDGLAPALDLVHQKGVIHRDIKPANILLHNNIAHLSDFGIAKLAGETITETSIGTHPYMAPEQWLGKPITEQTDIYQLGVMLFELLSGKRPFTPDNDTAEAYLNLHLNTPFPNLHAIRPNLPPALSKVLQKATAKEPSARYQTAGELAQAFAAALEPTPSTSHLSWLWSTGLLLLIALAAAWWQWLPDREEPTPATLNLPVQGTFVIAQNPTSIPIGTFTPKPMPGIWSIATATTASATPAAPSSPTVTASATPTATTTPSPTADPRIPPANPPAGAVWIRPQDNMALVYVPSGRISQGSTEAEIDAALAMCATARGIGSCNRAQFATEGPPQTVNLDPFWLDQTEVNNSQYAQCVSTGSCRLPEDGGVASNLNDPAYASYPVTYVTWSDARDYCAWVSGELPTTAQWEYAARGSERRIFPWGNMFVTRNANFCDTNCQYGWRETGYDDGYALLAPVASYPAGASWVGALDLAGNVWEWTAVADNSDSTALLRGGSWSANHWLLRTTAQDTVPRSTANDNIGFRCLWPVLP